MSERKLNLGHVELPAVKHKPHPYQCDKCRSKFTRKYNLRRHVKNCLNSKNRFLGPFNCDICEYQFKYRSNMLRHKAAVHEEGELNAYGKYVKFQCDKCKRAFVRKDSLIRHIQNCLVNWFNCDVCRLQFKYRCTLLRHKADIHGEKKLNKKRNLIKNLKFQCDSCQRCFRKRDNLVRHLQTHSNSLFKCDLCQLQFKYRSNMLRHKTVVHVEETLDMKGNYLKFQCDICQRKYSRKDVLRQHKCFSNKSIPASSFQCDVCKREFTRKDSLKRHCSLHLFGIEFKCVECSVNFPKVQSIFNRMWAEHNIELDHEHLNFATKDDFFNWKEKLEKSTTTSYRKRNFKKCKQYTTYKFICHRSGTYIPKMQDRKRSMKLYGTKKVGCYCPAQIRANVMDDIGSCKALYIKTHLGHNTFNRKDELPHIYLNRQERVLLENRGLLTTAYNWNTNSTSDTDVDKTYLNNRDLHNITTTNNTQRSSERLGVETFVSQHLDSVIYYKKQNELDEKYPSLLTEDIIVIVMSDSQKQILRKYGDNIVIVDGTHKITKYNFLVHTLLVVDDYNESIEVAFAVSNRNNLQLASIFFHCIKDAVGTMKPRTLMTDLEENYYIRWKNVMGEPPYWLFCSWHVKEAWRRNFKKIQNTETRNRVRNRLYKISSRLDENVFLTELNELLDEEDPELKDFLSYFCANFLNNVGAWADCYRKDAHINTNMCIDAFHSTLKRGIRKRNIQKNVSFNICLEELDIYLEFKKRAVPRKEIKSQIPYKLRILRKNHKLIEHDMQVLEIRGNNSDGWHLSSLSDDKNDVDVHFICLRRENCQECKLYCSKCETCIHRYECSCKESFIRGNMCIHIHSLCTLIKNNDLNTGSDPDCTENPRYENVTIESVEEVSMEEPLEEILLGPMDREPETLKTNAYDDNLQKYTDVIESLEEILVGPDEDEILKTEPFVAPDEEKILKMEPFIIPEEDVTLKTEQSTNTLQKLKENIHEKIGNLLNAVESEEDLSILLKTISSWESTRIQN